ncbi:hypothetical protein BUALT_Bualt06G0095800 [Buddleja alternifolia]|uniref:BRX domain-containing protein n=1 Tax=Buddleja alternifolia TaxID=168488 RepID=A0AAV6XFH1_9LAMI|nr:hypothetical protein BUALT_Bualt06G0095800 [Buddleja alternifolia]
MSRNYDNWERLVAAVIKKQQIWELCHAHSRSPSISSISSDVTSSLSSLLDDENLKSIESEVQVTVNNLIVDEWVEECATGVSITIVAHRDGTRDIKRVRFSRRRFSKSQAELWWLENQEEVYEDHIYRTGLVQVRLDEDLKSTISEVQETANYQILDEWIGQYAPGVYITLLSLNYGTIEIKRVQFSLKKFKEKEADTWWFDNQEKVRKKYSDLNELALRKSSTSGQDDEFVIYEPGLYITLAASIDGNRDVIRVRFSKRKFNQDKAEAWWDKNRDRIYERYKLYQPGRVKHSPVSASEGENVKGK